jgi:hypothetical protein
MDRGGGVLPFLVACAPDLVEPVVLEAPSATLPIPELVDEALLAIWSTAAARLAPPYPKRTPACPVAPGGRAT